MQKYRLIILGGIGGLLVLGLLVWLVIKSTGGIQQTEKVNLQFWGVFDSAALYDDSIRAYERLHPTVNVTYRQFSFADYERQLIDAFAAGTGPDIWLLHNSWLPKHGDKIQPFPLDLKVDKKPLFTLKDFQTQFVDVAVTDLIYRDQIYALPLYVDTLALFYNKDAFNTAGIATPPTDWEEFNEAVKQLTQLDEAGSIERAGAALGTAQNVNRSTDILGLLLLQSGVAMTDRENLSATFAESVAGEKVGEIALQYYTDFANPAKQVYTWNDQQHYSIDAFAQSETVMMINYSHQIAAVRAKTPRLNFATAAVPQLSAGAAINYANYWAPTVAKQSSQATEAWKFLVYLSSAEGATYYLNAAARPAARRDLIELEQTDPDIGVFATQALSARSWYQADSGAIETILADMIDEVNLGRASFREALRTAEDKVSVLMSKVKFR